MDHVIVEQIIHVEFGVLTTAIIGIRNMYYMKQNARC